MLYKHFKFYYHIQYTIIIYNSVQRYIDVLGILIFIIYIFARYLTEAGRAIIQRYGKLVNDCFTVVVDRDLFGNRSTVSLEASTADLARPLTGWSYFLFPPFETRPCRCQVRA